MNQVRKRVLTTDWRTQDFVMDGVQQGRTVRLRALKAEVVIEEGQPALSHQLRVWGALNKLSQRVPMSRATTAQWFSCILVH